MAALEPEHQVVSLRDEFSQDAKDLDWIPVVGKKGYVVISRDMSQRKREGEYAALKSHKLRVLYVKQSKASTLYEDAAKIIKNWPKIRSWGETAKPGTLAKLDTKNQIQPI